jgi:tight adherence protein C
MILALGAPALAAAAIAFVAVAVLAAVGDAADASTRSPASRLWRQDGLGGWARMRAARRLRLSQCGLGTPTQRLAFTTTAATLALLGALAGAWFANMRFANREPLVPLLGGAAVGAMLARFLTRSWLEDRRRRLLAAREASLPLALELLCICVNGGLGLGSAWRTTADSLARAKEPLAEELRLVELDVGLGRSWRSALDAAAVRTGMASLRGLGQLLEQAERFGSELADAIRSGVDSLLHEELQGLEERAHHNSVKMLFPLAMIMLPATLVVVPGPLVGMALDALKAATSE